MYKNATVWHHRMCLYAAVRCVTVEAYNSALLDRSRATELGRKSLLFSQVGILVSVIVCIITGVLLSNAANTSIESYTVNSTVTTNSTTTQPVSCAAADYPYTQCTANATEADFVWSRWLPMTAAESPTTDAATLIAATKRQWHAPEAVTPEKRDYSLSLSCTLGCLKTWLLRRNLNSLYVSESSAENRIRPLYNEHNFQAEKSINRTRVEQRQSQENINSRKDVRKKSCM